MLEDEIKTVFVHFQRDNYFDVKIDFLLLTEFTKKNQSGSLIVEMIEDLFITHNAIQFLIINTVHVRT